jgi:hypothetical protein
MGFPSRFLRVLSASFLPTPQMERRHELPRRRAVHVKISVVTASARRLCVWQSGVRVQRIPRPVHKTVLLSRVTSTLERRSIGD